MFFKGQGIVTNMFMLWQLLTISIVHLKTVCALQRQLNHQNFRHNENFDRRSLLVQKLPVILGGTTFANNIPAIASDINDDKIPSDNIFKVFQVIPDDSPALNPSLLSLTVSYGLS
jgi:hypothetical protein